MFVDDENVGEFDSGDIYKSAIPCGKITVAFKTNKTMTINGHAYNGLKFGTEKIVESKERWVLKSNLGYKLWLLSDEKMLLADNFEHLTGWPDGKGFKRSSGQVSYTQRPEYLDAYENTFSNDNELVSGSVEFFMRVNTGQLGNEGALKLEFCQGDFWFQIGNGWYSAINEWSNKNKELANSGWNDIRITFTNEIMEVFLNSVKVSSEDISSCYFNDFKFSVTEDYKTILIDEYYLRSL